MKKPCTHCPYKEQTQDKQSQELHLLAHLEGRVAGCHISFDLQTDSIKPCIGFQNQLLQKAK